MNKTLTINGRTYTPATTTENILEYLLANFENEAFQSSELVSDLRQEKAVSLVFKLDNGNNTYTLDFSGGRDEFPIIEGPILSLEMLKLGVLKFSVEILQLHLKTDGANYWPSGYAWFNEGPTTVFS